MGQQRLEEEEEERSLDCMGEPEQQQQQKGREILTSAPTNIIVQKALTYTVAPKILLVIFESSNSQEFSSPPSGN